MDGQASCFVGFRITFILLLFKRLQCAACPCECECGCCVQGVINGRNSGAGFQQQHPQDRRQDQRQQLVEQEEQQLPVAAHTTVAIADHPDDASSTSDRFDDNAHALLQNLREVDASAAQLQNGTDLSSTAAVNGAPASDVDGCSDDSTDGSLSGSELPSVNAVVEQVRECSVCHMCLVGSALGSMCHTCCTCYQACPHSPETLLAAGSRPTHIKTMTQDTVEAFSTAPVTLIQCDVVFMCVYVCVFCMHN